jgi:hypothetical protein
MPDSVGCAPGRRGSWAASFRCSLSQGLPATASPESSSARHGCRSALPVRKLTTSESGGLTDTRGDRGYPAD